MKTSYKLFLNGEWASTASKIGIINPATGEKVASVASAGIGELDIALNSARDAMSVWKTTSPSQRGAILSNAADILESKIASTALATCRELGKTVSEARDEIVRAIETLRWNGESAARLCRSISVQGHREMVPEPLGIVAAFVPWNYPAVLSARKLAPSLAAGCPVILKAAEDSPASAVAIVEALAEAGIPAGVVSLVFGDPPFISEHLMDCKDVRVVSFTGSTKVGKALAKKASNNLQQCVLELGGHAPVLVFADADLKQAAHEISKYKFECAGQSCNAPSRIFVERSAYPAFLKEFEKTLDQIVVGNGEDPKTTMGPMINAQAVARMERLKQDAIQKGASVHEYKGSVPAQGYFCSPAILTNVPDNADILREEPFGPILPIIPFDTVDDAINRANASEYGLAAYLFTSSSDTKLETTSRLRVGSISINMLRGVRADVINPGIRNSGYGYEGGDEGFRAFQNLKLVNRSPSDNLFE